jgi:hypothetical protein
LGTSILIQFEGKNHGRSEQKQGEQQVCARDARTANTPSFRDAVTRLVAARRH